MRSLASHASLQFFAVDLAHQVDFQIAVGQQLLQLAVLGFQRLQALDVLRLQTVEMCTPTVDRLLTNLSLLGRLRHAGSLSFPQRGHDLLVSKSALPFSR